EDDKVSPTGNMLRGRIIVFCVASTLILFSVATIVGRIIMGNLQNHLGNLTSLGLSIGLVYYLWQGHGWAKWTLVVLSGLGALGGIAILGLKGDVFPQSGVALFLAFTLYC